MSGGSDVDQFLQQPFVGPVFSMMCFFAVVLVILLGVVIYLRRRRYAQQTEGAAPSGTMSYNPSEHEMPDLNLLVDTPANTALPSEPLAAAPPPPARPVRKGTFAVTPKDGSPTEAVEVITILRDVVEGRLIFQMGDKVYQNLNSDTEFRDRFNRVMRELGQSGTQPMPEQSVAPPVSEPASSQPEQPEVADTVSPVEAESAPEPPPAPPISKTANAAPAPMRGIKLPGDLPSFKLDDNPVVKRGRKLEMKPVEELNVAGAIESYLQFKLQNVLAYATRSIHIHPSPDGGVSIEVDGRYYDAVSDIPDTEVREFIAQAIQEWQERH